MLKHLFKTAAATAGLLVGATASYAASVGSVNFTTNSSGGITVIAEDGKNYSKIETDGVDVTANLWVSMDTGLIEGYRIFIGACGALCPDGIGYNTLFTKNLFPSKADHNENISFAIDEGDIPQGLTQNLTASKIRQACQKRAGDSIVSSDVTFTHYTPVTLSLDYDLPGVDSGFEPFGHDWWQDYLVPVQVTCKALDDGQKFAEDLKFEHGDFKITDIDLFLSTPVGATTQPNPATTCKKGKVQVRLKASKAGPAKFTLWKKIGGNTTSQFIESWASHDGDGGFEAEHVEWIEVNGPTYVQAKAEELNSSFGMSTPWKDIMLTCSSAPHGGGFVQDTIPGDNAVPGPSAPTGGFVQDTPPSDNVLTTATYSGEIAVYNSVNSALEPQTQCPRQGFTTFKINSNNNKRVDYRVDCTGGRSWEGRMYMAPKGKNKFQGHAAKSFNVDKTELVSCVLKRVKDDKHYVLSFAGHQFNCPDRVIEGVVMPVPPKTGTQDDAEKRRHDALKIAKEKAEAERRLQAKIAAAKRRIEALKIAKEKAEAERRRQVKIAAEKRRRAMIAAQKAAEQKRQQEAAKRARLLKLQQERAKRAALAAANARLLQAMKRKQKKGRSTSGQRSMTTLPSFSQRMIRVR